jgi:hypothetical protein
MSAPKPVSTTPNVRTPARAPAHPQLHPHGLPFANILAQAMPQAPKPQLAMPQGQKPQTTALPQAVLGVHAEPEKRNRHGHGEGDELDPATRQAAQLAPPQTALQTSPVAREAAAAQTNARVSLEELVPQLVKKIAWSGDAQRGMVRMELGAGDLAGGTLTVSAENGRVTVHVAAPPGTDAAEWKNRISSRLEARGIAIDSVYVE